MKKITCVFIVLFVMLALASCGGNDSQQIESESNSATMTETVEKVPETNDALYEFFIRKWIAGETEALYSYAAESVESLMDSDSFVYMLDSVTKLGGKFDSVKKTVVTAQNGCDVYSFTAEFENISADVILTLKDAQIEGFSSNVRIKEGDGFTLDLGGGVKEHYFILENDGYALNAVYTYAEGNKEAPAVLLIPGSGPSDYNSTVGLLTPFADIAEGLAQNGINSLRIDKRTFNYADSFDVKDAVAEEYYSDFTAAAEYLKEKHDKVYLLGHSLGGQIASELAARDSEFDGVILWNSTARHLADVVSDQLSASDSANRAVYESYADTVKKVTADSAKGFYYFGAPDYYYAEYNEIDVLDNVKTMTSPVLIINSRGDSQIFDADISLWNEVADKAKIMLLDGYSHLGYVIDMTDPTALYEIHEFPEELMTAFSEFCLQN